MTIGGRNSSFRGGGGLSALRRGGSGSQGREGALVWARHYGGRDGGGAGKGRAACLLCRPWPAILPSDHKRALQTTRERVRRIIFKMGSGRKKKKKIFLRGKKLNLFVCVLGLVISTFAFFVFVLGRMLRSCANSQSRRKAGRQGRSSPCSSSFPLCTPTAKK